MLMGLRAGSCARSTADMVSEGNSGAPSCSPQGLAPCSLHGRAQPTVPRCPPLTHHRQWSTEAPAGAAAWCHPGCPGPAASRIKAAMAQLASAGTPAPAPCPAGRQHARLPMGSPQDVLWWHSGWVRVPMVLPCGRGCGLGRGAEVTCPHPSLHHVGRDRVGARQVGTGPRRCSAFTVHPTRGSRCLVWARTACGAHPPFYLQGPRALSVGRLGACYLCPGAIESPKHMLTHTKSGREQQRRSWGHCLGMLPAWGKADGLLGTRKRADWGDEGRCAGAVFLRLALPALAPQWQGSHLRLAADGSSGFFRS